MTIPASIAPHPTIRILQSATSPDWVQQALSNLDTILLDHAQCERKAASVALNLIFRYPSSDRLVRTLTTIAQEELAHFQQVNAWLDRRGLPFQSLSPPPYGSALRSQVRTTEPHKQLDSLLVAAMIEARSHERLSLLADHCPEPELAQFYRHLMASEARHYGAYWVLATTYHDRQQVDQRLQDLAAVEQAILTTLHPEPRIHS